MNDLGEILALVGLIIVAIVVVFLIASLPFAFIGWIILTVISIFTTINITYWGTVAIGFLTALIITILK